ncbi:MULTISPECIES: hypothetical protein [unclassified Bradyrhizobium]|uniref:hypothetical protein n=1 Tax=unclassified Bradyrhizobium TaxID=2631580 RepID=UPI0008E0DF1C|nr:MULTISPECIES: hypothetical protein [unclassified Bradyrhizobium]MBB4256087.1 uncharacterized membrane protein YidH (DUF202 family) [Bradyrhizobium sp. CIR3A]MBB4392405.1 uncharacterized membrane protein YidH (DUF202 family) [Bradyrhizobium sp. ERR14]NYG48255.1 uncharacterized membrane protein YidH (DUF202 family) [Bradyrhizobium sp. IAR9]SFN18069.1 hypothetical protein SAMN05216573_10931 [Bradyrhizobium sp. Rc3b]
MTDTERHTKLLYWAGVALGPLAWGINLQGIYTLAHFSCESTRFSGAIMSAVLAGIALAGTAISARAVRRGAGAEWSDAHGGGPRTFMAWLGVGSGVLFALVIADQLAASLLISPCLR